MLKRWYTLAFATGAMSISLATVANAEETVERTGADAMIEEVVVTARRREEGLQSAPIAISAYTGDSLDYRGVTRLDQIAKFAPGADSGKQPKFWGCIELCCDLFAGYRSKRIFAYDRTGRGPLR